MKQTHAGRISRSYIGNVAEHGAEFCARAVRQRVERECLKRNGVVMLINDKGDVFAPGTDLPTTMLILNMFPWWKVCEYCLPPRWVDAHTPSIEDIAEDIEFHVGNASRGSSKAAA